MSKIHKSTDMGLGRLMGRWVCLGELVRVVGKCG